MHYLIKSNDKYYDLSNSSYNQPNQLYDGVPEQGLDITNWLKTSTLTDLGYLFSNITIGTETFKPIDKLGNFSIISDENRTLNIKGIKTNKELIIMDYDILIDSSQIGTINSLTITGNDTNKVVFSIDSGSSWKSYNGQSFVNLFSTVPLKSYNELTETELGQRNDFKNEVDTVGINFINLKNINFNSLNFTNIRFAYLIKKSTYTENSLLDKITMTYNEEPHLIAVKKGDVDIKRYSHTVQVIPSYPSTYTEIRIFTHENFENVDEDNRKVLDAPVLNMNNIDNQITLEWNEINNADYYKVYANGVVIYQGSELNYTYISSGTGIFIFAVRAYANSTNAYKQSEYSNSAFIDFYKYLSSADKKYIGIKKNGVRYRFLSKK